MTETVDDASDVSGDHDQVSGQVSGETVRAAPLKFKHFPFFWRSLNLFHNVTGANAVRTWTRSSNEYVWTSSHETSMSASARWRCCL